MLRRILFLTACLVPGFASADTIPRGAILAFVQGTTCPSSWTELANSRGSALVGAETPNAILGTVVGSKSITISQSNLPSAGVNVPGFWTFPADANQVGHNPGNINIMGLDNSSGFGNRASLSTAGLGAGAPIPLLPQSVVVRFCVKQ